VNIAVGVIVDVGVTVGVVVKLGVGVKVAQPEFTHAAPKTGTQIALGIPPSVQMPLAGIPHVWKPEMSH